MSVKVIIVLLNDEKKLEKHISEIDDRVCTIFLFFSLHHIVLPVRELFNKGTLHYGKPHMVNGSISL